jgi:hypothetical protein
VPISNQSGMENSTENLSGTGQGPNVSPAFRSARNDRDRGCSAGTRDDGRDEVGYSPSL